MCSKYGYDESTISVTLFYKFKFGFDKALEMLYNIANNKKETNSIWLA